MEIQRRMIFRLSFKQFINLQSKSTVRRIAQCIAVAGQVTDFPEEVLCGLSLEWQIEVNQGSNMCKGMEWRENTAHSGSCRYWSKHGYRYWEANILWLVFGVCVGISANSYFLMFHLHELGHFMKRKVILLPANGVTCGGHI